MFNELVIPKVLNFYEKLIIVLCSNGNEPLAQKTNYFASLAKRKAVTDLGKLQRKFNKSALSLLFLQLKVFKRIKIDTFLLFKTSDFFPKYFTEWLWCKKLTGKEQTR